jgi:hypothetical protein
MPKFDSAPILDRIKAMSADEFEGRAPGTKGEELTVQYLEEEFKKLGLQPGNTDGTFVQKVPLVGITGTNTRPLTIAGAGATKTFKWKDEVVAWTKHVADGAAISDSEMIFAGYGVTAPEFNWDDFKGVDVKGKTIVVLVNDPQVPDAADPAKLDDKVFNGKAMTYYGRWTYKFEEGARRGAAGILIVHEEGPAGYPFQVVQGNLREKFDLVTPDKNMGRSAIEGWVTLETARAILKMAGPGLRRAEKAGPDPRFQAGAAQPQGVDRREEHAAHHRLAQRAREARGQRSHAPQRARRLYGALGPPGRGRPRERRPYLQRRHRQCLRRGAAARDRARVHDRRTEAEALDPVPDGHGRGAGPARLAVLLGHAGLSASRDGRQYQHRRHQPVGPHQGHRRHWHGCVDLDDYLRDAATEQGRVLRPDPESEKGFYYRSDHFNFAKQGVPALYVDTARSSSASRQATACRSGTTTPRSTITSPRTR